MTLRIYNSLTKQKEEFRPLEPGKIKMYVCGPTVYDEPHIGHLRSAHLFDVMRRYLESPFCHERKGYRVEFVRNVTDVDDKIIEKARNWTLVSEKTPEKPADLKAAVNEVAKFYLKAYHDALSWLEIPTLRKSLEPKATEYIPQMVEFIKLLLSKQLAYAVGGDVYFDVNKYSAYGKLSHQKKDEMLEAVRIDTDKKKRNPLDFALWKEAKVDEPAWDGPIENTKGRPGWHIECSVMSMECLKSDTIDIHGGGRDLIFPHHENEIAQSEGATGKPFVRYWIHHGLVTVNGQKMSKSLKNYVTIESLMDKFPNTTQEDLKNYLKLLFLGTHYSKPLDFSDEQINMEHSIHLRFLHFFQELESDSAASDKKFKGDPLDIRKEFCAAMDDDFNTPLALSVLHQKMTQYRSDRERNSDLAVSIREAMEQLGSILGLSFVRTFGDLKNDFYVKDAMKRRAEAKKNKDFKLADQIREKLLKEKGIILVDKPDGTSEPRKKL